MYDSIKKFHLRLFNCKCPKNFIVIQQTVSLLRLNRRVTKHSWSDYSRLKIFLHILPTFSLNYFSLYISSQRLEILKFCIHSTFGTLCEFFCYLHPSSYSYSYYSRTTTPTYPIVVVYRFFGFDKLKKERGYFLLLTV